jgi:hypothetical protein
MPKRFHFTVLFRHDNKAINLFRQWEIDDRCHNDPIFLSEKLKVNFVFLFSIVASFLRLRETKHLKADRKNVKRNYYD